MASTRMELAVERLRDALQATDSSARLEAALAAGSSPEPDYIEVLIERCAIEPDFLVRDMLTWALIRNDAPVVVARLLPELDSAVAQARAQALHTLSKMGQADTWSAITPAHLQDEDEEVARTAWRAAAGLVPESAAAELAETLATQFARGGRDVHLSLSRAFVALGEAASAAVERATTAEDPLVSAHAIATARLMWDPEQGFDAAIADARRAVALRDAPNREA